MKYYLDRFEGSLAILECEGGKTGTVKVDRSLISPESREGDALVLTGGRFRTDRKLTAERRRRIREQLERLKGRGA